MSKRKINTKQADRIRERQKKDLENNELIINEGLVIAKFGKDALVETNNGSIIHCSIRATVESIVTGDKVYWQAEGKQGVILSCSPRHSVIGRPDHKGILKPIAANITQLVIVIAIQPEISWSLLDSYLVLAEYLKLATLIVLNKTDLSCLKAKEILQEIYQPLGYDILQINNDDQIAFKVLKKQLQKSTSIFVGQSGVGKSSIISKLIPHESIETAEISIHSELGKHTTSTARLFHLYTGGDIIDSPGVREFSLWNLAINEIANGYREFRPYINECKFRDCNHIKTKYCAVIAAMEKGLISQMRYENYVKLVT